MLFVVSDALLFCVFVLVASYLVLQYLFYCCCYSPVVTLVFFYVFFLNPASLYIMIHT